MTKDVVGSVVALLVVFVVAAQVHETAAVTCNVAELYSCTPAIVAGQTPTAECCNKLKEQQPCFCEYFKNPAYKKYVNTPNSRKLAAACGIAYPTCT